MPVDRDSPSAMRELMAQAMDDGYALAAAREPSAEPGKRSRWAKGSIAIVMVVGLLLTVAAIETRRSAPAAAEEKRQLIEQVESRSARVDRLRSRSAELEAEVAGIQKSILNGSSNGQRLQNRLDTLELLAGTSTVTGPGIRIVVDDAGGGGSVSGSSEEGRILDVDLQHTVNGLWAAGAEAVSINGQRISSMTPIRGANQAITVGYRPLARPYIVRAIGDPSTLESRFASGSGGAWLSSLHAKYHIRLEIETVDHLRLPPESGVHLRFATTEGSQ